MLVAIRLLKVKVNSILKNLNQNNSNSLQESNSISLPIILNTLDISIPENSEPIINYSFGVFLLSLICLLCFINVVGYLSSIYLIQKYNIEEKIRYSILKRILRYYEKSSLIFVIIEGLMCIIFLLALILSSLAMLGTSLT